MILITGATGFVGKNLIKDISPDTKIRCLVRKLPKLKRKNIEFLKGDITNPDSIKKAMKGVKTVIHMAAVIKSKNKKDFQEVNVVGTKNILDACKKNKVKKLIHISSYDVTLKRKNNYAISKLKAENLVKASGIDYIILRPTVIYGKDENANLGKLFELIKKLPIVPVIGNGRYRLQPIYIKDLTGLIIKCISSDKANKTFFAAGPRSVTFNQIVDKTAQRLSKKVTKIHVPILLIRLMLSILPKEYSNILSITENKTCNIEETTTQLGFKPLNFDKGLEKTL